MNTAHREARTTDRRGIRRLRRENDRNWFDSPWRIAGRAVSWALMIVVVALVLALAVVPRVLGGDSLTVLSGSMEPTFSPGDVIVVRGADEASVCQDVSIGTIVTYFPKPNDPTLITHRVVGKTIGTFDDGTTCRLLTQGDANSAVDEPVSPRQVRGTFLYGVPGVGWARQWVGDNLMLVAIAVGGLLIGWGLWTTLRRPRTHVVSVPRPTPSTPAPPSATAPADAASDALRERELALREREITLREREFDYTVQQSELAREAGLDLFAPLSTQPADSFLPRP
ncbi:signal peptidase I [Microbacterium sp. SORGH_AS_0888]|uniref:signal peptidase I n=1 Tax=Microbacterium sp. SORGH_AS_0888 TaxID=3041791 RepID=UPI00277FCDB1|nr:signal peptidase I [Microbacterium sp. SORGH_AS_0888]MDQ1130273.1 signal peptidase [Microbacterium sp. SORGH_AS_0888]